MNNERSKRSPLAKKLVALSTIAAVGIGINLTGCAPDDEVPPPGPGEQPALPGEPLPEPQHPEQPGTPGTNPAPQEEGSQY